MHLHSSLDATALLNAQIWKMNVGLERHVNTVLRYAQKYR